MTPIWQSLMSVVMLLLAPLLVAGALPGHAPASHPDAPWQEGDPHEIVDHHSLLPPFIAEWWQGGLPYWEFGGHTVVTDKFIRVVPDKQSRVGWLWNFQPNYLISWQATLTFRIHGRGSVGADGLALWLVERPFHYLPSDPTHASKPNLWGINTDFKGLGIIFDTYDNDGQRDNPVAIVVRGQGHPHFRWDIENDLKSQSEIRCPFQFRQTAQFDNVRARVRYTGTTLSLWLSVGIKSEETFCGQINNFELPTGYYFGITATTGHLADNHDIFSFVITAAEEAVNVEDVRIFGAG
eukprot:RCo045974